MNLEDRILERIRTESIRPLPLWLARLLRGIRAAEVAVALLLSSFLVDVFLDRLLLGDAGPHRGFRRILSDFAPWAALAAALLVSWLAWRLYRRVGTGYRRSAAKVVATFFACALGAGIALHATDAVFLLHRTAARTFPSYRSFFQDRRDRMRMEHGPGGMRGRGRHGGCQGAPPSP